MPDTTVGTGVVKVLLFDEEYAIQVGETVSERAGYGEALDTVVDGERYLALLDVKEGSDDEVESCLPEWVYVLDGDGAVPEVEIVDEE